MADPIEAAKHYAITEEEEQSIRAYIEAVAGQCDCDEGRRYHEINMWMPCDRCVVVDLPDIKGVRVRHEATDEDFDTGEVNALVLEVVDQR